MPCERLSRLASFFVWCSTALPVLLLAVCAVLSGTPVIAEDPAATPTGTTAPLSLELIDSMLALDSSIEAKRNAFRSYRVLMEQRWRPFLTTEPSSRTSSEMCESILSRLEKLAPSAPISVCGRRGFSSTECRDRFKELPVVDADSTLSGAEFDPLLERLRATKEDREAIREAVLLLSDELLNRCQPAVVVEEIVPQSGATSGEFKFAIAIAPLCRQALDELLGRDLRNPIALCLRFGILSPPCIALREQFTRMVRESRNRRAGNLDEAPPSNQSDLGEF